MSTLRILDATGDTQLCWAVDKPGGDADADLMPVEEVRARFDELVKSHLAYVVEAPQGGGEALAVQIHRFDPSAEEIVLQNPLVGG